MTKRDRFKYLRSSLEIIRLAVMMCVRFPLSLRKVEDLLHERGIDNSHEAVQRFRRMRSFAEIRRRPASVFNHFNQDRSLYQSGHFKLNRAAVLTEWSGLCTG